MIGGEALAICKTDSPAVQGEAVLGFAESVFMQIARPSPPIIKRRKHSSAPAAAPTTPPRSTGRLVLLVRLVFKSCLATTTEPPVPPFTVKRLTWRDEPLGSVDTPNGRLPITRGLGSGLCRRAGDPQGQLYAIGDRGPNLKIAPAIDLHGLTHLKPLRKIDGAKIMPRLDIGPAISQLQIRGDTVHLVRTFALRDKTGGAISGLPIPSDASEEIEPVFALDGTPLPPDPAGADTESIAALRDGSFWVGEEYGPSLLKIRPDGRVALRWSPKGTQKFFNHARYPVSAVLPKIAARRRLNRGFEALALSPDERWLYVVFQSALAHPNDAAHARGRIARIWKLDAASGKVAAQFLYPFDRPDTFARDGKKSKWSDLKLCEALTLGPDKLLLLERISKTAKFYAVDLRAEFATPAKHLKPQTRPTLEQMSKAALREEGIPLLPKTLLFSTDAAPQITADLEGMALLSPHDLILVNDNDFAVEGAKTQFWRVRFKEPLLPTPPKRRPRTSPRPPTPAPSRQKKR